MSKRSHPGEVEFVARLAANLKARRRAAGLTLRQLAERTGYSYVAMSQVEHGQAMPSAYLLARLAAAYGCTMDSLAGEMPTAPTPTPAFWRLECPPTS